MRIDHLAYRVKDRKKTSDFFINAMGYKRCFRVPDGFQVNFDDGTFAKCTVLVPSERKVNGMPWEHLLPIKHLSQENIEQEYHAPPEIFISEGSPGSIVDKWVKKNGNRLHHVALQVKDIRATKKQWEEAGYATFASEDVLTCPGLQQIFSDPCELTGNIWELIERDPKDNGFCEENVKNLMLSTSERQ